MYLVSSAPMFVCVLCVYVCGGLLNCVHVNIISVCKYFIYLFNKLTNICTNNNSNKENKWYNNKYNDNDNDNNNDIIIILRQNQFIFMEIHINKWFILLKNDAPKNRERGKCWRQKFILIGSGIRSTWYVRTLAS